MTKREDKEKRLTYQILKTSQFDGSFLRHHYHLCVDCHADCVITLKSAKDFNGKSRLEAVCWTLLQRQQGVPVMSLDGSSSKLKVFIAETDSDHGHDYERWICHWCPCWWFLPESPWCHTFLGKTEWGPEAQEAEWGRISLHLFMFVTHLHFTNE